MKNYILSFTILLSILFGQDNPFKIKPKYKNLKLISDWTFDSMETITYTEKEEKDIVIKDKENLEIVSFYKSGKMSYNAIDNGKEKKGSGEWLIKDDRLRIISGNDTIDGTYKINDDILTITTIEDETEEFYGYKIIVKYRNDK